MDAADRAELDALRRRAYGPDDGRSLDRRASERLAVLEAALRGERPGTMGGGAGDGVAATRATDAVTTRAGAGIGPASGTLDAAAETPKRGIHDAPRWPAWRRAGIVAAAVAGTAAIVVLVSTIAREQAAAAPEEIVTSPREAYTIIRDPSAVTLLRIPVDAAAAPAEPGDHGIPPFPTSGEVETATPLGEHYGWSVWIAEARGALQPEDCIVVTRGRTTRGRCVPSAVHAQSAVVAVVPSPYVDTDRPPGMRDDQRLGFWWTPDGDVAVLLADEVEHDDGEPVE